MRIRWSSSSCPVESFRLWSRDRPSCPWKSCTPLHSACNRSLATGHSYLSELLASPPSESPILVSCTPSSRGFLIERRLLETCQTVSPFQSHPPKAGRKVSLTPYLRAKHSFYYWLSIRPAKWLQFVYSWSEILVSIEFCVSRSEFFFSRISWTYSSLKRDLNAKTFWKYFHNYYFKWKNFKIFSIAGYRCYYCRYFVLHFTEWFESQRMGLKGFV